MTPILLFFVTLFAVKAILIFKPNLPYVEAILAALSTVSIVCAALVVWRVFFGG